MSKDLRLNQQATVHINNDLIRAGFVKASVVKDGTFGRKSLATSMTEKGTKLVATYANALRTIRNPTKRKVEVFNAFLTCQGLCYMRQVGWIR